MNNFQYKELIIKILSDNDIPFSEAGKNVSHGYMGVKCPFCFVAGEMVLTKSGMIPIEQIIIGDNVLSTDSNFHNVTNIWSRKLQSESVVEYLAFGMIKPTRCTTNHELFVAEVVDGMHIGGSHFRRSSGTRAYQTWYPGILKSGRLTDNTFNSKDIWIELPDIKPTHNVYIDDAYFLGLFCADGYVIKANKGRDRTVIFALHETETDIAQRIIFRYGGTIRHSKIAKCICVSIFGHNIVERFNICGSGHLHKMIPFEILFNSNKRTLEEFIEGLVDGDGHEKSNGNRTIGLTNPHLVMQTSIILHRLGHSASTHNFTESHIHKDGHFRNTVYRVNYNINDITDESKRHSNIRCINGKWYGRLKYARQYRKLKCFVYNITVNSTHNYCINGSMVKNCDDSSNHLGINLSNMMFSCWKCHTKGHLAYLLTVLLGISRSESEKLITEDIDFRESPQKLIYDKFHTLNIEEARTINKISLPRCFELIDEEMEYILLDKYLTRRKYTREFLISRNCGVCRAGPWMHRLIIPVYLNGEFVSFQGADLTGKADLKYKAGTDNIKSLLYNYDGIEDVMVVTEGVLDAWRVGDNAVCSFGTSITDDQKQLIINKNLKHLVFMWDSDAYWYAKKEAEYFRPFVDIVDVIKLPPDADPDEMEHEELNKILYGD